jgi:mycothiol synthase
MRPQIILPKLALLRSTMDYLPQLKLNEGYTVRTFQNGDETHWERIISEAFKYEANFEKNMKQDPHFKSQRICFVCYNNVPVATTAAWYRDNWSKVLGEGTGYIHMVAVSSKHTGKGLGQQISLYALQIMKDEGFKRAVLATDDFRFSALSTYLKIGFEPLLMHENQRQRWIFVFESLSLSHLENKFSSILEGKILTLDL